MDEDTKEEEPKRTWNGFIEKNPVLSAALIFFIPNVYQQLFSGIGKKIAEVWDVASLSFDSQLIEFWAFQALVVWLLARMVCGKRFGKFGRITVEAIASIILIFLAVYSCEGKADYKKLKYGEIHLRVSCKAMVITTIVASVIILILFQKYKRGNREEGKDEIAAYEGDFIILFIVLPVMFFGVCCAMSRTIPTYPPNDMMVYTLVVLWAIGRFLWALIKLLWPFIFTLIIVRIMDQWDFSY